MKRLNTILIGFGKMGRNHFRVLSNNPNFNVIAIIDPLAKAELLDLGFRIRIFPDLIEFYNTIQDVEWDCAVVAAPTELHFSILNSLLEKNKPVLIEKPLAATPEQGRELVERIKKLNARVAVGHLERFNPVVQKLKALLESNWLGDPIHFSSTRIGGYPNQVNPDNNVLLDLATHDLDVLNFLVGPMTMHSSICHSTLKEKILDTAEILLVNSRNISAALHVNWITPTKIRTLRLTGTQGVCFVDYILQTISLFSDNVLKKTLKINFDFESLLEAYKATDKVEFGIEKKEPLKIQLEEFFKFVSGFPSNICTVKDALYAVEMAHEAIKCSNYY